MRLRIIRPVKLEKDAKIQLKKRCFYVGISGVEIYVSSSVASLRIPSIPEKFKIICTDFTCCCLQAVCDGMIVAELLKCSAG